MKKLIVLDSEHGKPSVEGIFDNKESILNKLKDGNNVCGFDLKNWEEDIFPSIEKSGSYQYNEYCIVIEELNL